MCRCWNWRKRAASPWAQCAPACRRPFKTGCRVLRGGFAAAILTGDRSGVDVAHLEDLRNSNLAHLLAISGLHMGLLTGFVFAALRFVLALWPAFALRVPTRKLAALGGLAAGGAVSGALGRERGDAARLYHGRGHVRRGVAGPARDFLAQRGHGCCDRAGPAARGAGAGRVPDELLPPQWLWSPFSVR